LNEEVYSELNSDLLYVNPDNLIYAFGGAYTNLYQLYGPKYMIGRDCGTDLLCVPQRRGDWYDGGEWIRYHRLTWNSNEKYIYATWLALYNGIDTCNKMISIFEEMPSKKVLSSIAELRALRAFYYLQLVDLFGNVPLVIKSYNSESNLPKATSRDSIYLFIEKELNEVIPALSKKTGSEFYGRINYNVAQMTLAKLYLNAEIYTGTAKWELAEACVDTIIKSSVYQLTAESSSNFIADASNSKEILLAIPFDKNNAPSFEIHLFTLHYLLTSNYGITSVAWNGICAQESLFNLYETADDRLKGLLYGNQYNGNGEQFLDYEYTGWGVPDPNRPRDPDGAGLNLTPNINMLEPYCLRQCGTRIAKFPFIEGSTRSTSNDFPIYRYSDVMLMKAELRFRAGDNNEALSWLNQVRIRSNAKALSVVTEKLILDERARELFCEGHRRTDLIRFGKYLDARWEKNEISPNHVTLWPIPANIIESNKNLIQNPGYTY
jgi:hypothetical protein